MKFIYFGACITSIGVISPESDKSNGLTSGDLDDPVEEVLMSEIFSKSLRAQL
jgi:hypothetical protein